MTKIISLSDDAYEDLKALKSNNESFSDVVRKMTKELKGELLLSLVGGWKDSPELDNIMKGIIKERHKSKERKVDI